MTLVPHLPPETAESFILFGGAGDFNFITAFADAHWLRFTDKPSAIPTTSSRSSRLSAPARLLIGHR